MKPNYKRIIKSERERYGLEGLNIQWPLRKKGQPTIVYRDIIKNVPTEIIKERIVEKKIYVDKIVEKIVEVEKPIYIEKVVTNKVYIDQTAPPQATQSKPTQAAQSKPMRKMPTPPIER